MKYLYIVLALSLGMSCSEESCEIYYEPLSIDEDIIVISSDIMQFRRLTAMDVARSAIMDNDTDVPTYKDLPRGGINQRHSIYYRYSDFIKIDNTDRGKFMFFKIRIIDECGATDYFEMKYKIGTGYIK